jgi:tetratricopeptide (TPR) repeat protein
MTFVPICLSGCLWGISTDLEKIAAAFPAMIGGRKELQDRFMVFSTAFFQGLQALGNDESLVRSDILMGIAEAYAQSGQEQEALRYIGLTQEHFPDYPENDPSYIYAECGTPTLYQWEGKMYLELVDHYADRGYQQKASNALLRSIGATSLNDRCTNETIIYQADAARVLGELNVYASSLRQAARMAIDLGGKKRYSEALQVYQRTPASWTKERQIQLLAKDVFKQLPSGKVN